MKIVQMVDSPSVACDDCASTAALLDHGDGSMSVQVRHSDTCPTWQQDTLELAVLLPKEEAC